MIVNHKGFKIHSSKVRLISSYNSFDMTIKLILYKHNHWILWKSNKKEVNYKKKCESERKETKVMLH